MKEIHRVIILAIYIDLGLFLCLLAIGINPILGILAMLLYLIGMYYVIREVC